MGYRFTLQREDLPGKPDIVLPQLRLAIQVRGCFWHGHKYLGARKAGSNAKYWLAKIAGNKTRDRRNDARLRRMGWSVRTVWECRIRTSTGEGLCHHLEGKIPQRPKKNA